MVGFIERQVLSKAQVQKATQGLSTDVDAVYFLERLVIKAGRFSLHKYTKLKFQFGLNI